MSSALQNIPESLLPVFLQLQQYKNGAAEGTGILKLLKKSKEIFGNNIPTVLEQYVLSVQHSTFGDYPHKRDIAPSVIFMVVFFIFFIAHLYIFTKNFARGHKFWLSLLFAFYCLLRVLGWLLRIVWACNIMRVETGLASSVFIIVSSVFLAGLNLVLAQRIFTWRHPKFGSRNLFWAIMIGIYAFVTGVVVMAIVGAVIPYIYFLSEHHYHMCKQVVQAAAIFNVLFSLLAGLLCLCAFIFKPSSAAQRTFTYSPWWIESFDMFYYVPKNSCQMAEDTFKTRDAHAFNAVRVIASTSHQDNAIEKVHSVTSKSGSLDHNHSILIIMLTTSILLLSSIFRCVSTFIDDTVANQSWIFKPVVMYIMFGLLETMVNVLYLTGRVDLRFYRPDKLRGCHRGSASTGFDNTANNATLAEVYDNEGGSTIGNSLEAEKAVEPTVTPPPPNTNV